MSIEDRLDAARNKASKAREIARKREARTDELAAAARSLRESIFDKRKHRQELDEVEDAGQRERIADKIDEIEADLDRVVDRLDRAKRRSKAANEELAKHNERVERLRKRRQEQREDAGPLTPNFSVSEFDCRDGTPVPSAAIPALKAWCEDVGEPVRAQFGAVYVNSGFRTASYNASIGGASNSIHIYTAHPQAVAVDFTCARGTPAEWFDFTAGKADGRGRYSTFHHADNRNRIGWSDAVWYG